MPLKIELPQVGETVTEGTIQKWLKKPGDRVEKYEPLAEVETDKVTMEVPSPVAGVLVSQLVPEGAKVAMGAPICEIETSEVPAPSREAEPVTAAPAGPPPFEFVVGPGTEVGVTGVKPMVEEGPAPPVSKEAPRLSPVVQRLAAEHGVSTQELARIPGTGIGGRVTKQDLLKYLETRAPAPAAPAPPKVAVGPEEEALPLTPIRRRIAENMVKASTEVPMAWSAVEVDVTSLVRWREGVKEEFQRREGVELTYLPFIAKAVAESLKENPKVNSAWGGDKILLKKRINLGIAVGAPQGLVVPVVKDADHLSIAGLAKAIRDVVARARENRLTLQDVQGGTFTVNNTGALGSVVSQAIQNYPQAALLTTESIVKRPVVVDDAIAIRHIQVLTITFDHRVLDGLEAGAFMQSVKRRLEAMGPGTPWY